MIKAGINGFHEVENRCKQVLQKLNGNEFIVNEVKPFHEVPNGFLNGITDELPISLDGDDDGVNLSGDKYYRELALSLVKHIKSGKAQSVSSYVQPKGKTISRIMVQNGVTNNIYKGLMNMLNLSFHETPYFATLNNIEKKNGKLKKGARFNWAYFQRVILKYEGKLTTWDAIKKLQKQGAFNPDKYEHYSIFKKYKVFNFIMIEGDFFENKIKEFKRLAEEFEKDFPKTPKRIDAFLKLLPNLNIKKGTKPPAFYSPMSDYISMPPLSFFSSENRYFQTLFHELGHWTGHESRLDRLKMAKQGSEIYAKEELVAELTGYFLVNEFKLMEEFLKEKSAGYLNSWSTVIKVDKAKKLIWAYKKAVEASEYVLKRDNKGIPKYIKELAKKETPKPTKKTTKQEVVQTALFGTSSNLFIQATQRETQKTPNTFRLKGEVGKFMQDLQRYRLTIAITGDPHAGKSEFVKQLVNSFLDEKMTCGFFDLEQGGIISKDTAQSIDRNITKENQKRLFVSGESPNGIDTIKQFANQFDIVVVDSWQKLNIPNTRFDELRQEFPNTIFIIIFQQNGTGGTRGGVTVDYDTPIAIKVHKIDATFKNNYAELLKNRGNTIGLKYFISIKSVGI